MCIVHITLHTVGCYVQSCLCFLLSQRPVAAQAGLQESNGQKCGRGHGQIAGNAHMAAFLTGHRVTTYHCLLNNKATHTVSRTCLTWSHAPGYSNTAVVKNLIQ